MIEQPYSYQQKVQGGVSWDRKKLLKPNLHVYGKDDTQIMVYSMRRSPRKRNRKNTREKYQRTSYWKKNSLLLVKLLQPSYSGYAKDNLCILYSQYFFQTTYDRYLFSIIRLVLSPILYKFIVWACWAETQSCLGFKPKLVLTKVIFILKLFKF